MNKKRKRGKRSKKQKNVKKKQQRGGTRRMADEKKNNMKKTGQIYNAKSAKSETCRRGNLWKGQREKRNKIKMA